MTDGFWAHPWKPFGLWVLIVAAVFCVLALLVSCGPPEPDHSGEAGHYCKPDGTCIGKLVCVNSPVYLGMPIDARPSCRVKP